VPTPDFVLELRAMVGHTPLWLPGVTGVVVREGDPGVEVLCVRSVNDGHWTAICGIVEPGEDPHVAVVREALEEADVVIGVERLVAVAAGEPVTYANGDVCIYLDHTFRCRWLSGDARIADDESTGIGWFTPDALPRPMTEGMRRRIAVGLENPADVRLGRH